MFEDIRHQRSLIALLSIANDGILKQVGLTDHEIYIMKSLALDNLHRQNIIK